MGSTVNRPRPGSHPVRRRSKHARSHNGAPGAGRVLARYTDMAGAAHEIVCIAGAQDSRLLVDRSTLDGQPTARLIAHLAAEESEQAASSISRDYLTAAQPRRHCRAVNVSDLNVVPAQEYPRPAERAPILRDRDGSSYRLQPVKDGGRVEMLRWCRLDAHGNPEATIALRALIGRLESYEPARSITWHAINQSTGNPDCSVCVLRAEFDRLNCARTILNRGLREAVQAAVASGALSMSEIAARCGRAKSSHGGDTSWLARRTGQMPETSGTRPTPWIHSDVLALIARQGLGVSPHEVELG